MKTHFGPSSRDPEDAIEKAACGTWLGETSDTSEDWSRVNCKRCLRNRKKFLADTPQTKSATGEHENACRK